MREGSRAWWVGLCVSWVLGGTLSGLVSSCVDGDKEVKVVKQPMELSEAAKVVRALEPVIDKRWQQPICFLAMGGNGPVAVRVPCRTLLGAKTVVNDKTNRVVTHQTLYPPESQPAEKPPAPKLKMMDGGE